jgi:DNA-binding CsgD family transcriptional regulator
VSPHTLHTRDLHGLVDHRLPFGMLLLDSGGKVLAQNHAAQEIVAAGDGLSLASGHLIAASAPEADLLQQLVADACAGSGSPTRSGGSLVVSRRAGRRPLSVLVAPLRPMGLPGRLEAAVAVAFVNDPDRRPQTWLEVLRDLYALTPTESAIALSILGGANLEVVATERRISRNTVRTHLCHILVKTGAASQADLVRVLLGGPVGRRRPRKRVRLPVRR